VYSVRAGKNTRGVEFVPHDVAPRRLSGDGVGCGGGGGGGGRGWTTDGAESTHGSASRSRWCVLTHCWQVPPPRRPRSRRATQCGKETGRAFGLPPAKPPQRPSRPPPPRGEVEAEEASPPPRYVFC
jgi:hypothetical protein